MKLLTTILLLTAWLAVGGQHFRSDDPYYWRHTLKTLPVPQFADTSRVIIRYASWNDTSFIDGYLICKFTPNDSTVSRYGMIMEFYIMTRNNKLHQIQEERVVGYLPYDERLKWIRRVK